MNKLTLKDTLSFIKEDALRIRPHKSLKQKVVLAITCMIDSKFGILFWFRISRYLFLKRDFFAILLFVPTLVVYRILQHWTGVQIPVRVNVKGGVKISHFSDIVIVGESVIGNDSACLFLGDNIFHGAGFTYLLKKAVEDAEVNKKATVFGYWVHNPERYGVAEFDKEGNCLSIEEKPKEPKSNYAVVGLYFYPNKVVDVAKHIKPSARGELEITTVNQEFLKDGELKVQTLGRGFAWLDTGTHDSLSEASTFVEVIEKRQGLKVACLEGIAYRNGWISEEKMRELAKPMLKNQYGQYLLRVIDELKESVNSDTFRK